MTEHQRPQSNNWTRISFAIAAGVGLSFCFGRALWPRPQAALARATGQALAAHQFGQAVVLAQRHLAIAPMNTFACLIGAEASRQNYDYVGAAAYVSQLAQCDDGRSEDVAYCRGVHAQQLGRVAEAEELFRETLRRNPVHMDANRRLTYLLQLQGRLWESVEFILPVLQSGVFLADELLIAGNSGRAYVDDEQYRETCLAAVPSDCRLLVNSIRQLIMDNHVSEARQQLGEVLKSAPNFVEALIYEGHLLLRGDDAEVWNAWNRRLPKDAERHPDVWYVRGLWAKQQQTSGAVRCFLEAVSREPNHSGAVFQLSQLLVQQGQQAAAKFYAERSTILSKLDYFISELRNTPDLEMMRQTVDLLSSSRRYWEAIGWCRVALMRQANLKWAKAEMARLRPLVAQSQRLVMTPSFPKNLSPENFPLPNWNGSQKTPPTSSTGLVDCRVRFEDMADVSGLNFQYFNGTTPSTGLEHMLQSTGGGVAVIDYDLDSWPDLYFAQSGVWPLQPGHGIVDQLFRNTGDNRFEKVTASAAVGDDRYSQGVTVSDFNNDGFPDLYVCNVGENRFYENQGDGTFRDITQQTGTECPVWSLSCAFADLNGDSLPDLYVANYLRLPEVLARECKHEGRPMGCAPTMFPAEQDRLYLNLGDGTFREITQTCGIVAPDGKGLALIIGDFDESRRLSVFVGNDTTANFLFANQAPTIGAEPRFREEGVLRGVAFDEAGKAMSSMGVAAGDADGDGRFDLFITTFYADSNCFLLHQSDHSFVDSTRTAQLRDNGFNKLGFGAQFLDGELDGRPDLIVTNGHVDRTFATGVPDLMSPQFFQNRGEAQFVEVAQKSLGPFFERKCLGRSLVRLDWNRDGREDFCVSHLDVPVALLTNTTDPAGHSLCLQLRGVRVDRDAIGTTVRVRCGERTWTQQLLSGDGYMAANQRQLVFGLGSATTVDELQIEWLNGRSQKFEKVPIDREWLVLEGQSELFPVGNREGVGF